MSQRVRLECKYSGCNCYQNHSVYKNNIEICSNCGHGSCWHRLIQSSVSQFISPRCTARVPKYSCYNKYGNIPIQIFTPEPPLPVAIAVPVYCASIELLPI